MLGKQHNSGGASADFSREAGRESSARNTAFAGKQRCADARRPTSNGATGNDRFRGPDCSTCTRFEPPEPEPFVGPEVVAKYLDIDAETVVRYARLGYIPAHPLHVVGKRTHWRFLLSEVHAAMLSRTNTYSASDEGQRGHG